MIGKSFVNLLLNLFDRVTCCVCSCDTVETDSTNSLNLARTQIGTWTHSFKVESLTLCLDWTEVRVLYASTRKEFSERQSDRQEIDLLG